MKNYKLIIAPLIGLSFLVACKGGEPQPKEWYQDETFIKSLTNEDVGLEKEIIVNGLAHKVRLIGIDHDDLADGTGKAHTTWEFANLLSDSNGYSLAVVWNWEDGTDTTNINFPNTNLRKALDGIGTSADFYWYQKGETTKSKYTSPVISMLPNDLQSILKTVKKPIAVTDKYEVKSYDTNLFILSHSEMTLQSSPVAKSEGEIYEYYKKHDDNPSRMKHQIKWYEGAAAEPTTVTDGKVESSSNWAGCNAQRREEGTDFGGAYWLRSPWSTRTSNAFNATGSGAVGGEAIIYKHIFNVAPVFCL